MADRNNIDLVELFGAPDNVAVEDTEGTKTAAAVSGTQTDQIDLGALFGPPDDTADVPALKTVKKRPDPNVPRVGLVTDITPNTSTTKLPLSGKEVEIVHPSRNGDFDIPETYDGPSFRAAPPEVKRTPEDEAIYQMRRSAILEDLQRKKDVELIKKYPNDLYSGSTASLDAFAQGLLPVRDVSQLRPGWEEASPFANAFGQLTGLIALSYLTAGVGPAVSESAILSKLVTLKHLKKFDTILRIAGGRAAQAATVFSLHSLTQNLAELVGGQEKTIRGILTDTGKAAAFGAGLGLAGSVNTYIPRVLTQMAYGFTSAKIEKASNLDAGIRAAVFGVFGLFNTQNLTVAYKKAAFKGSLQALEDRLMASGKGPEQARAIADRFMRYALWKGGAMRAGKVQWGKVTVQDFRTLTQGLKANGTIILNPKGPVVKPQARPTIPRELGGGATAPGVVVGKPLVPVADKFVLKTDIPFYDNLLGNQAYSGGGGYLNLKEYMNKVKGIDGRIVYMSPTDYIARITEGFWKDSGKTDAERLTHWQKGGYQGTTKSEVIKEIADNRIHQPNVNRIGEFEEINMPVIEYDKNGRMIQEGHHRAEYAKQQGAEKIPVFLVHPTGQPEVAGLKGETPTKPPVKPSPVTVEPIVIEEQMTAKSFEVTPWTPLEKLLEGYNPDWIQGFMYMGDEIWNGKVLHGYKHGISRKTFYTDDEGHTFLYNGGRYKTNADGTIAGMLPPSEMNAHEKLAWERFEKKMEPLKYGSPEHTKIKNAQDALVEPYKFKAVSNDEALERALGELEDMGWKKDTAYDDEFRAEKNKVLKDNGFETVKFSSTDLPQDTAAKMRMLEDKLAKIPEPNGDQEQDIFDFFNDKAVEQKAAEAAAKAAEPDNIFLTEGWDQVKAEIEIAEAGKRIPLEDGTYTGYSSTFPSYAKNKGWRKAEIQKVIEKAEAGKKLTPKQQEIFDTLKAEAIKKESVLKEERVVKGTEKEGTKLSERDQELSDYFTPGELVPGYIGIDRVIAFRFLPNNDWEVTVQKVNEAGEPVEDPRTHRTFPEELVKRRKARAKAAKTKPAPTKETVKAELDAISKLPFPLQAEFMGEEIIILGGVHQFEPYKSASGGKADWSQLLAEQNGKRFIVMASQIKIDGSPLVTPMKSTGPSAFEKLLKEQQKPPVKEPPKPPVVKKPPTVPAGPLFKKPTLARFITAQNRMAELLGLKWLVEPAEIGKMKLDRERAILDHQIGTIVRELTKLKTVTPEQMAVLLNTHIDPPKELGGREKEIFEYFRSLTREILRRVNESRVETGRDPIEDIGAYFRHLFDSTAQDIVDGKFPLPEKLKAWANKNVSKKVYNPMELQRKIKDELLVVFSNDLGYVMRAMVRTGLKEIHMGVPLKFFHEELAKLQKDPKLLETLTGIEKTAYLAQAEMPQETKEWVTKYVNIVLGDQQTQLDKEVNLWVTGGPVGPFLDKFLAPFGKQIGKKPLTDMIVNISKLPLYGVLGPFNPKQLIRNKFQIIQSFALYGVEPTIRGTLPTSDYPILEKLKTDSLFLQMYSGIEDMPLSLKGKLEKFNFAAFQWTAVSNVSQAMNTAYHWTANMIQNPKCKGLGWADPQRTYKEDKDFFYPSELPRLLKEMEYGAQTTQYGYLGMMMPQAFRYKAAAGFTRLNSWWMNHWAIFQREAATRAFLGHTGYDTNLRIPMSQRINYLKYLVLGGLILNTMGYTRSFLFGTAPTGLPPVAKLSFGLYQYYTNLGEEDWKVNNRREAGNAIKSSLMTFIPGYLTIKDASAFLNNLLTGEKAWSTYLFYKKKSGDKTFYAN